MQQAAARLAADLPEGAVVNLGRGLPGLVASALGDGAPIWLQAENGILGVGQIAEDGAAGWLTDASKRPVTLRRGAAIFDLADSFDMIRSGRIDVAVLGAFEVSHGGDLANHASAEPTFPPAVGGAMDLAACAREVWVLMRHRTAGGGAKFVEQCTLPVTAAGVVRRVYTDLATYALPRGGSPILLWQSPSAGIQQHTERSHHASDRSGQ
jgi:3-oxoadipate CoA-transferase beta subunit